MRKNSGLTLTELMVGIAIMAVLASVIAPNFMGWLPNYRLKRAARDLYSNMQLAKLGAIRANSDWAIVFDTSVTPGRYFVCSDDGGDGWDLPVFLGGTDTMNKMAPLTGYGSSIGFGHGHATTNATAGGGVFPGDDVGHNANVLVFDSRGLCNTGFVYLENNGNGPLAERHTFAVGTRANGGIVLRKWFPANGAWGSAFGE